MSSALAQICATSLPYSRHTPILVPPYLADRRWDWGVPMSRSQTYTCLPGTQAASLTGRNTLRVVAGCLPTAPAPPACATRASSPVPKSSVSAPASGPSRGPVTAVLAVLVLGTWRGREPWAGASTFLLLRWARWQGWVRGGSRRSSLHSCTLLSPRVGDGSWRVGGPPPGMGAGPKVPPPPVFSSHLKAVSMRAGSMSLGRASSLEQTPAKCASVR